MTNTTLTKKLLLPLAVLPVIALASCGSAPATPLMQSQSTTPVTAQSLNLSSEGQQMLRELRSAAGRTLVENDYINLVANSELSNNALERSGNPEVYGAHQWARNELTKTQGPVVANWIRAYVVMGKTSSSDAIAACKADTASQQNCADALSTATHAAASFKTNTGNWVLVFANLQGQMKVTPVANNR